MYWLDTNVFIEANNTYYPFTRVPKFWAFVSERLASGELRCCKPVYEELLKQQDQLSKWVKTRKGNGMCVQPENGVFVRYKQEICDHIIQTYNYRWYEEFCSGADGWVVAYAMHFGGTVVTQESRSRKRKIRIPIICKKFDVPWMDTFQMLETLKAKF